MRAELWRRRRKNDRVDSWQAYTQCDHHQRISWRWIWFFLAFLLFMYHTISNCFCFLFFPFVSFDGGQIIFGLREYDILDSCLIQNYILALPDFNRLCQKKFCITTVNTISNWFRFNNFNLKYKILS